ncbi:hypothetical protein LV84_03803 [Algoriphagus ratkowskyi]|uniref:O-antigen ligase-like membrane protein n=1 Tax=Algoriphagus ratkowskyi TaxID=57028 RepID=A0A2W7QSR4_9BACT|nr:hypothetical protein [Algoriphagus ratkowskyi]PZX51294.1 hypothetical protein LV84_03803 [Algoriphagus ratkowskyi]TXD75916.1 hypothetical protein ESW18_18355 [Algoriphagus ratkowskyi]
MEKTKLDYFFVFFFILIAAKTSFVYEYDVFWFIFSISCFSYGLYKKRIYESDLYTFAIFTAIFILFIIFRNLFFNKLGVMFLVSDVFFLLKYILISYIFCVVFKKNATILISEVIIFLAKISLALYVFQLVGGGGILFKIGETFHNSTIPYSGISATYSNFIFFTYDKLHHFRNSGFVWEPGAYGCFLVIALLFHFMNNYFVMDRNAIILIIATITTISTTAYLALGILMVLYYRFNEGIISWKMILLSIVGLILFFNLPFLGEKITNIYEEDIKILQNYEEITNQLAFYEEFGGEVKLNRFSSIIFLYQNFGYQLIFGVSNAYINLNSPIFGVEISKFNISNGTIDFIAKFGLVGFAFLLFRMGKFIYLHYQKFEYSLYMILMILVMNFGEPLLILPITLIFLFLPKFSLIDYDFEEENDEIHELSEVN